MNSPRRATGATRPACTDFVIASLVTATAVLGTLACAPADDGFKLLYEKESLYHYLRVTESYGIRYLQFRRAGADYEETALNVADPLRFEMRYYRLMFAAFAHQPAPKEILFIGLGGGTLPRAIHHHFPDAAIHAVELDPEVAKVAKKYFGFREGAKMKLYVRDGRVQVRRFVREGMKFDLIMLDAFRGGYIPYHLTTKEFVEQLASLLRKDGVVASNLRSGFVSYDYQRRTLAEVFRHEYAYGSPDGDSNVIVVHDRRQTARTKAELVAQAVQLQTEKKFDFDLPAIVRKVGDDDRYERKGRILTDDFAPTDVLRGIPKK